MVLKPYAHDIGKLKLKKLILWSLTSISIRSSTDGLSKERIIFVALNAGAMSIESPTFGSILIKSAYPFLKIKF